MASELDRGGWAAPELDSPETDSAATDRSAAVPEAVLDPGSRALIERPENRDLLDLYRYWDGLRADPAEIPPRHRFDPVEVPRLLARIFLAEVVPGPRLRVRYRLIGSEIIRVEGRDHTGRFLDEINPDPNSPMRRHYADVVGDLRIYVREDSAYWAGRDHMAYRALLLPLASEDGQIRHILGAMTWDD